MYVCMYVSKYICIFIKLHITTQSGPVILVILCHSHVCMYVCTYVCMYGHTYSKSMEQPGKVSNSAGSWLNRKNEYFPIRVRA